VRGPPVDVWLPFGRSNEDADEDADECPQVPRETRIPALRHV
jgi:hypothetical protein